VDGVVTCARAPALNCVELEIEDLGSRLRLRA
jgi:hypothetical protein